MTKVAWNKSLSIGITLLDEQHKSLIRKLNDVSSAIENGLGQREITKTLEFLSEYADFHFSAEEKHMKEHSFPGLEKQKIEHQEFMDTLSNLEQEFEEEGSTSALSDAINDFLFNWLTNHIQGLDQEFGDFLAENNA